jgi:hypothetical protein
MRPGALSGDSEKRSAWAKTWARGQALLKTSSGKRMRSPKTRAERESLAGDQNGSKKNKSADTETNLKKESGNNSDLELEQKAHNKNVKTIFSLHFNKIITNPQSSSSSLPHLIIEIKFDFLAHSLFN